MDELREKLVEILRVPIFRHEQADPAEVVADYLMDNDVVPVVRCKDCVYYLSDNNYCGWWNEVVPQDGYCHKGEKDNSTQECQSCAIEFLDQTVEVEE